MSSDQKIFTFPRNIWIKATVLEEVTTTLVNLIWVQVIHIVVWPYIEVSSHFNVNFNTLQVEILRNGNIFYAYIIVVNNYCKLCSFILNFSFSINNKFNLFSQNTLLLLSELLIPFQFYCLTGPILFLIFWERLTNNGAERRTSKITKLKKISFL